uniref:Uncharacterized protein n=1 Tax=Alexandrium monilatum TaxID=311494 RepID=A0A7S4VGX1_9DINO
MSSARLEARARQQGDAGRWLGEGYVAATRPPTRCNVVYVRREGVWGDGVWDEAERGKEPSGPRLYTFASQGKLCSTQQAEPQGCDWAGPAAQCFVSMAGVEASLCAYPEVNVGAGEQDWGAEDPEEAQRQLSTTPSGTASTGSLDSSMPRPPSTNGKRVGMGSFFRTSEIDDATSSSPLAAQRSAWHLARQGVYSCAQHCAVHL